jgi:hypothetical protein
MLTKKHVRIIKKIRGEDGVWRFISLRRAGSRYIWDKGPGYYFLDWREGKSAAASLQEVLLAKRLRLNVASATSCLESLSVKGNSSLH